jgi:hypothetical protein
MDYNLLLAYLSQVGSGSWQLFRDALGEVLERDDELYPSRIARRLSSLAHVEYAFESDLKWAICPPAIVWLPNATGTRGVLCGMRSERVINDLVSQAGRASVTVRSEKQAYGPDVLLISSASSDGGQKLADHLGLASVAGAAEQLARSLPDLDSYFALATPSWNPSGYGVQAFQPRTLQWVDVNSDASDGLYSYGYYTPEFRLVRAGQRLKVARDIAVYKVLALNRQVVITYDSSAMTLSVPARAPLPALHDRAAVLASGRLPSVTNDLHSVRYVYSDVPAKIASAIISTLHQQKDDRR